MAAARIIAPTSSTPSVIAMDVDAAMVATSQQLNAAMVTFDRWASQNPEKLSPSNAEFKQMKQIVKRLRLKLKEQQEMQSNYAATFGVLPGVLMAPSDTSPDMRFARPRNNQAVQERQAMDDSKNCVLLARREYTIMLNQHLYPGIYQGLKSIWDDAKKTAAPRRVYEDFQNRLARVKKWNQDVIDNEYRRIVDKSRCEWLDDLIKQVFVINTHVLASVNMHTVDPSKKIKVKVPKGDKFIHFCYKECARAFYEEAPLMEDRAGIVTRVEQIKNRQKAYKLITTCIENTVRNMLPIESLLKGTMQPDDEGEDATPLPMFPSLHPPPLSDSPFVRRNSSAALEPRFPTYDTTVAEESDKKRFDPETLFAPRQAGDRDDRDSDNGRSRSRERERDRERERTRERTRELGTFDSDAEKDREREQEQERGERERERENDRERERKRSHRDVASPEEGLKTIYIGSSKGRSMDRELRSEDSEEAGGGQSGNTNEVVADISTAEIPMVGHRTPDENIDLDVNTDRNELHIIPKKSDETGTGSVETIKEAVPPIEHFDTAHFFSDVE